LCLPGLLDRSEVGFDLRPARLQERRQRDVFAQRGGVFVDGEAGAVGGDFKEDAARFAFLLATPIIGAAAASPEAPLPITSTSKESRPATGRE